MSTHAQGDYLKVLLLRTIGNFLILASLFLIAKTFYQPVKEEVKYVLNSIVHKQYIVASSGDELKKQILHAPSKGGLAQALNINNIEVLTPADPNFSIIVPKIGANARVIPNVNPADEDEYLEDLKHGVAHAAGTAFPGEKGHIFLFAHSTDYIWNISTYNAVFYLLYKLNNGDEVNLFYKGHRFVYKVTGTKIVDPSEVQYITRKTNHEFLTLQTCWPPGTSLKRLLVFAERVAE